MFKWIKKILGIGEKKEDRDYNEELMERNQKMMERIRKIQGRAA